MMKVQALEAPWPAVRLRRLCNLVRGRSYSTSDYGDEGEGVPFVNLKCVGKTGEFSERGLKWFKGALDPNSLVKKGDLLIANTDLTPSGQVVGGPIVMPELPEGASISMDLSKLVVDPARVMSRYLYYGLSTAPARAFMRSASRGSTVLHLEIERAKDCPIPIPPLAAQRVIADFLDTETARIDALIAKKRRLIDLISERVTVEQVEAASGRTLGVPLSDSGLPWLGSIPVTWHVERLKYVARLETGHTPSRTRPELWENCTTPWVTLNDVGYLESHEFVERTVNLISAEGLAASSARVLPEGTVILSRDATVGRCGVLAEPMATSQHFVNWVCGESLQPRYLWLLFRTVMQKHFDSLTAGATLRTIGMPDVKEFVVPVPPADDQARIIGEAETARLASRRATDALTRQIRLLVEHRQALITAAVTGELAVPGVTA